MLGDSHQLSVLYNNSIRELISYNYMTLNLSFPLRLPFQLDYSRSCCMSSIPWTGSEGLWILWI